MSEGQAYLDMMYVNISSDKKLCIILLKKYIYIVKLNQVGDDDSNYDDCQQTQKTELLFYH